jgi:energy-coupling factor transporter ATP-binding protein EcfA2
MLGFFMQGGRRATTMAEEVVSNAIEARIGNDISGQVAVGTDIRQYNLKIASFTGHLVVPGSEQRLAIKPRKLPILERTDSFPDLLDREQEINSTVTALQKHQQVEFYGRDGSGKTTLLKFLSHHYPESGYPDGVICLWAKRKSVEDLLQALFDAFYDSDPPYKPSQIRLQRDLKSKQALAIFDDFDLPRDEIEVLNDTIPGCGILFASSEQQFQDKGKVILLAGLPIEAALDLFRRGLGRNLDEGEGPFAGWVCTALDGHPLSILQASALIRDGKQSLDELARRIPAGFNPEEFAGFVLETLSEEEQPLVKSLATIDGASVNVAHLHALSGSIKAESLAETLLKRHIVQAHSPRYSLAGNLLETVEASWDLTSWRERTLEYFIGWIEQHRMQPLTMLEEVEAVLKIIQWAFDSGRWADALRLIHAFEGALVISKRWTEWHQLLRWALEASRKLGNQLEEAWAQHQLGTLALCTGNLEEARTFLTSALSMRRSLGDEIGAEVTQNNLSLLGPIPAPPTKNGSGPPARPWLLGFFGLIAVLAVTFFFFSGGLAKMCDQGQLPFCSRQLPPIEDNMSGGGQNNPGKVVEPQRDTSTPFPPKTTAPTQTQRPQIVRTDQPIPPQPPAGLQILERVCNDQEFLVVIGWSDQAENEIGYHIYRDGERIGEVGENETAYPDNPPFGGPYEYGVEAFNEVGPSARLPIQVEGCSNQPPPEPPAPVGNLFVSGLVCNEQEYSVTLSWVDQATNEFGYRIYRDGKPIQELPANQTEFRDLPPIGDPHSYGVVAYNEVGESDWADISVEACNPVPNQTTIEPPEPPSGLNAEWSCSEQEFVVSLTWEDRADNELGYRVYRDGEWISELGPNETAYRDNPPIGGPYLYEVEAFNEAGSSERVPLMVDNCNPPLLKPPEPPSNLMLYSWDCSGSTFIVQFTWEDRADNELGYRVYRDGEWISEFF